MFKYKILNDLNDLRGIIKMDKRRKRVDRGKKQKGQLLSMGDLSALIKTPIRSVQYWVKRGLLIPAQEVPNPERKKYLFDFENLLQARLIKDMLESGIGVDKLLKIQKNLKMIGFTEKLKHGFLFIKGNRAELIAQDKKGRDRYFDVATGRALLFSTNGTYKAVKKMLEEEMRVKKLIEDQEEEEIKTIKV